MKLLIEEYTVTDASVHDSQAIEHLFGFIVNSMNGSFIRTIGITRAKAKIGMIHPVK